MDTFAKLKVVGSFREDSSYPNTQRNAVLRGGYLYVLSYDNEGVYKINIANPTNCVVCACILWYK